MKPATESLLCAYCSSAFVVRSREVYRELSSKVLTLNWEAESVSFSFFSPRIEGS